MFTDRISEIGTRFLAWTLGKSVDDYKFDSTADSLADKILIGDISQEEAEARALEITANGEFPGRNLRDAMLRSYVDVQIRNDPKEYYSDELKKL